MLILIVAGGPDKGRIYELEADQPTLVGREDGHIRLTDRKTSRRHARIWSEGGKWYVEDLGSRHGTLLNGEAVDRRAELQDGDRLQIGKTLFVLGRMTVEQAERFALLAHAEPAPLAGGGVVGRITRKPALLAGAAAVAAGLIVGSNLLLYVNAQQQSAELTQQLAAAQQAVEQTESLLTQLRDRPDQDQTTAEALQRILAAVERQPDAAALDEVLAAVRQQPEADAKALAMLESVATKLEAQPSIDPLLEEVRTLARSSREQQEALAAKTDANTQLLETAVAEIRTRPDSTQLAQALDAARQADSDANAALLEQVLANLDQQKALAARVAELQDTLARQPEATKAAIESALAALPNEDDAQIAAALAELRQALPPDVSDRLDRVLARMDEAASPEQVAAAVKDVLNRHSAATVATLERLTAKVDAQSNEAVLARLDEMARSQPSAAAFLAAVENAVAQPDPALIERLDALAAGLAAAQEALAAQPAASEEARQLAARQAQTQELLQAVLDEVRNREPLVQLQQQLEQLAAAATTGDPEQARKLDEVLAALQDRSAGETDGAVAQQLASIHDLVRQWPTETEAMLQEAIAAAETARATASPDVDAVLQDIRQRALARLDELGSAMQQELRLEVRQQLAQLDRRPTRMTGPRFDAAPTPAPGTILAQAAPPADPIAAGAALMTPNLDAAQVIASEAPQLSAIELAYKHAFETGKPVTIGAGAINPLTGEAALGRTIDPTVARAAGLKSWREWYLMDDFAERMRLKKEALRVRLSDDSLPGDPSVITLPSNTVPLEPAPEPAAESAG